MVLLARDEGNWVIHDAGVHAFTLIIFHDMLLGFVLSSCLSLINIVGLCWALVCVVLGWVGKHML